MVEAIAKGIARFLKGYVFSLSRIYANEEFEFEKIRKIFGPYIEKYENNIPKVFLATHDKKKKAFCIDWTSLTCTELKVSELS